MAGALTGKIGTNLAQIKTNINCVAMIIDIDGRFPFFHEITGVAMQVHTKFHGGLLESAYEAALAYLLPQKGYLVERQVYLPIYWNEVQLDQNYRMDLVINKEIIVEIKASKFFGIMSGVNYGIT